MSMDVTFNSKNAYLHLTNSTDWFVVRPKIRWSQPFRLEGTVERMKLSHNYLQGICFLR